MLGTDRSDDVLDGDFAEGDAPACVALVPVTQAVHWAPKRAPARPDASFVTQLIATAEQAPQTRTLRRGSLADAQTAYGAGQTRRHGVGFRTRQVI
jgi:hypothetical protein